MSILRRFLILGFLLVVAAPGVRAQSVALNGSTPLVLYGLTFSISSCSLTVNGIAGACPTGMLLQNVPAGRGNIEFAVVNSNSLLPVVSRATSDGAGTTSLSFVITVSSTGAPAPSTLATSAALIASGVRDITCTGSGCVTNTTATASISNYGGSVSNLATLTQSLAGPGSQTQTLSTAADPFTPDNAFHFRETLSLTRANTGSYTGLTLKLNSAAVLFRAAPEPASISALLVGLAGLVVARRRRRS